VSTTPCTFCRITAHELPASTVFEDDDVLAIMDHHPVNPGHVLVPPKRHFASLAALPEQIGAHLFTTAQRVAAAIRRSGVRCEAIALTLADGEAAGQEVPHVHLHVIPRFTGDAYRVVADYSAAPTRETLDAVARSIRDR
jgi:histidine triad (HIT) family protein